ncbi:glycosyltransferase family 39 protein [Streptacidiphilus sp. PB12-B1b]|uniref:ArnT family glycosyltransferase n=1 Tax=Streptacidiphilus sp. PB12-B1b TaxID=2705012 RepID=UPI0015F9DB56|nr:glycosyltransferase family 39 protein [Streptacidiphilus sp. PB12-B1b]QMU76492.1 glycosyltransferase family 39 protein [Streptacidiphilus sp. PB12-B1b]
MATTAVRPDQIRTPRQQPGPRHARPALILIAAVAALLFTWDIGRASYHPFYADAVRSMTMSWKAFLYGSFDPGNTITLDKLPGFLWPQALSARLLGFHPWALALPQAVEGVLSVLVLYRAVRTWAGTNAGLLAAAAFTLTPVVAGLFRTSVEDPAFTLLLLLAAEAAQRAARDGRTRTLLLSGLWVGLAFQAKMLEAFAVLPVLACVYLLSAPPALRRRLAQLLLAGAVALAVSASWVLLVSLTPAHDRPYVDGTTDNSAVSMVVGYNFLNRFSSVGLSAESTGSVSAVRNGGGPGGAPAAGAKAGSAAGAAASAAPGSAAGPAAGQGFGPQAEGGWGKMLAGPLATQTGWLYPLGVLAFGFGLYQRRRTPRTDVTRAGFLLWGGWLATYLLVFSAGSVGGHTYYMGVVAAPLAALAGAGLVLLWRAYRSGERAGWALPAGVAASSVWGALVARDYPGFLPWLAPAVLVLGLASVLLLAVPLRRARRAGRNWPASPGRAIRTRVRGLAAFGLAAGLAAVLLAPAAWSASVFNPKYGHSGMGAVGPVSVMHRHLPKAGGSAAARSQAEAAATAARIWGPGAQRLSGGQRALMDYVRSHRGGAQYLFATTNWSVASPYILATGARVLPMGGFTDQVPSPTLSAFERSIAAGRLHYVLLGGAPLMGGPVPADTVAARAAAWVSHSCQEVPVGAYGGGVAGQRLYRCARSA